jgi:hypothetical protein
MFAFSFAWKLLRDLGKPRKAKAAPRIRPRPGNRRLYLESLEDRAVLSIT